jgi:MOSC domain-containing protein YiiM
MGHSDIDNGRVDAIYIAPSAKAPTRLVPSVEAIVGIGLAGDRYATGTGTYWKPEKPGQEITLIEGETLDLLSEKGIELDPGDARRNIVTRGVSLATLLRHRFAIGPVECVGVRDCPPCAHLEALTVPGVHAALEGLGGLRADIVVGGVVAAGDIIRLLD